MKQAVRVIFLIFAFAMAILPLQGCGEANTTNTSGTKGDLSILNDKSEFPITNEKITLKVMAVTDVSNFDKMPVFKEYEKMSNIHIDWQLVSMTGASEIVNMTFASNNLPDAYFKCNLSSNRQIRYGSEGQLLNLNENDMLKKYAPHFSKFMEEYPDVRASQTFPDGEIFSLPAGAVDAAFRIPNKVYMNTDWLKAVNKSFPKNIDELYDVLKAFKKNDPNKNGIADEVPMAANLSILSFFKGIYGLGNRGSHHPEIDVDEATGKSRLIVASPRYREMLKYVKKLYGEELISQEIFTNSAMDCAEAVNQNKTGMYMFTGLSLISANMTSSLEGIEPMEGPYGDAIQCAVRSHLHSTGAFAISRACKYPEAALRWVDYFYSDEGCLLYHFGVEGDTCVKEADGSYRFSDKIMNQVTGSKSFDEVCGSYSPWGGGNNPSIMKSPFFGGAEAHYTAVNAAEKVKDQIPKTIWPIFNFTLDEDLEFDIVIKDITGYAKQATGEFITGKRPLDDKNWNEYLDTIDKMGASRAIELNDIALKRSEKILKNAK